MSSVTLRNRFGDRPNAPGSGQWGLSAHARFMLAMITSGGLLLGLAGCAPNLMPAQGKTERPVYLDVSQSVPVRVQDLIGRMTLAEKAGQMTQISVSRLWGDCRGQAGALNTGCLRSVLGDDHVGSILSGGGEAPVPNQPRSWAETTNAIQKYAIQHSRLHIPILYGVDAVHGHNNVLGATIFPHNIGMAASWDPGLVEREQASTARAVRATGVRWAFAPVADIARDLRWGRYYETFGEDPYLASAMVGAAVRGFQGRHLSTGVAATVKHFVGYSEPLMGQDRTFAELPLRYLREIYLPSFQAGIDSGVATVMVNSGSVNEVPAHASHYLLTDLLRGQMGFKGVTISDWQDIEALYDRYHVATNYQDAVRMAVIAGVDMSMVPYDAHSFTQSLIALVRSGKVPVSRIDQAVRRILTLKIALGLFQHPYVDASRANGIVRGADRGLARRAADESMVLLKNGGRLLPLGRRVRSILVTGPSANSVPNQMGGWTIGWQGITGGERPPAVTILEGIKRAAPRGTRVTYVGGGNPGQAARAARRVGVAIVVVGEKPYAEGAGDTETEELPAAQSRLVRAIESTGTPTIIVLVAGRPLIMRDLIGSARGVLMAWLPGTEGGDAVADVLFGRYDPSGRLPVSWPRSIGQEPLFYESPPGTYSFPGRGYDPLFPFGHGLSYTRYSYSQLRVTAPATRHGTVRVSVRVANTGGVAGDEVVQAYVHPEDSRLLAPARRLVAFARVHLGRGRRASVRLAFPTSRLRIIPGDVLGTAQAVVEPGSYTIMVGGQSARFTVR